MKHYSILFFLLAFVCCTSNSDEASTKKEEIERAPKINFKDYKIVKIGDYYVRILKDLSKSQLLGGNNVLHYNHLSKEKHVRLDRELISDYKKSLNAREIKSQDLLKSYANEKLQDFKGTLKVSTNSKFKKSKVNEMECLRTYFEGASYGFPQVKCFNVRYLKGPKYFYTFIFWSTFKSKVEFINETLAMGLSLKKS